MNLLKKAAGMLFTPSNPRIAELFGTGGISDAGETVNHRTALQVSTVFACVSRIAGTLGTLPVEVVQVRGNVTTSLPSHPLQRILGHSPNYDQTPLDFFEFMGAAVELEGDAIAHKIRGVAGNVIGLDPLVPTSVGRRRVQGGKIEYSWAKDGRSVVATEEDILHIRGPGGDALRGLPTLAVARDAIGLARAAERTQSRMFRNGVRPTVAFTFAKWLTDDQKAKAEAHFGDRVGGVENSGKPIILQGDTKIQTLSINPIDAELLATRAWEVEDLCRFFDMPPVMVGHTSKTTSWPTGVEAQFLIFLQLCLRKRVKRFETAMEKQLLTPAEYLSGVRIRFNFEALLRADSKGRAEFYQTMRKIGAMTINEIRALEGWPPVEGGDVVLVQMQDIPISQAGKITSAAKQPAIGQGDNDADGA